MPTQNSRFKVQNWMPYQADVMNQGLKIYFAIQTIGSLENSNL